jgi:hypothetical protein
MKIQGRIGNIEQAQESAQDKKNDEGDEPTASFGRKRESH